MAEYNVTALFHKITAGEEYGAFSTEMTPVSKKMQGTNLQDKTDESEAKKKSEIEPDQKKNGEKLDKPATDESPGMRRTFCPFRGFPTAFKMSTLLTIHTFFLTLFDMGFS